MDLKRARQISEKALSRIEPLIRKVDQPTLFSSIILGALRRDYLTLYTIMHLSDAKEEDRIAFGSSCMDLMRRTFEDLINIQYIKLEGKDKYSKQFASFKAVEAYRDLEYLMSSDTKMDAEFVKKTEDEYFALPKDLRERSRWSGMGVEGMIALLLKKGVIKQDEFRTLSQTYNAGNYKNHFSPTDIFNFLYNDLYQFTGKSDLVASLIIVVSSVIKIARELIEECGIQGELKVSIDEIWQELLNAHLE